jgi:hypothetical protein
MPCDIILVALILALSSSGGVSFLNFDPVRPITPRLQDVIRHIKFADKWFVLQTGLTLTLLPVSVNIYYRNPDQSPDNYLVNPFPDTYLYPGLQMQYVE